LPGLYIFIEAETILLGEIYIFSIFLADGLISDPIFTQGACVLMFEDSCRNRRSPLDFIMYYFLFPVGSETSRCGVV
jgi:hypothetical protein